MLNNVGLVLAGGGGKGAYQIGVWRALAKKNIIPRVVSGTSVGALNGALFLQQNLSLAQDIWSNIAAKNVLSFNVESLPEHMAGRLLEFGVDLTKLPRYFKTRGLFSQQGLLNMMSEGLTPSLVANSGIDFFVCAHDKAANRVAYFQLNQQSEPTIRDALLASCALPGIFDDIEINGRIYTDGGWYWGLPNKNLDNSPVQPVYEKGCQTIILVCLGRDDLIQREQFPNARIIPIVPSQGLGGMVNGVVDFSNEGAVRRMEQGYQDAMRVFEHIGGFLQNEQEYERLWREVETAEAGLIHTKQQINQSLSNGLDLTKAIDQFNHQVSSDAFDAPLPLPELARRDLLTEANRSLLTQIERDELALQVTDYLERNLDNAEDARDAVLDAVACLAPVDGRALEFKEQGFFARLWGSITGRNQQVAAENQQDLAKAQYAAVALINHVQSKQLLTFEMTVAVNNKVNWLFGEVAAVNERINQQTVEIYRSLATIFFKLRQEIVADRNRIESLEARVGLLEWLNHIDVQTYEGKEYRSLATIEKLLCAANDFYLLTGGHWNVKELLSLKAALIRLGIEEQTLSAGGLFDGLLRQPRLASRLTAGLSREGGAAPVPLLAAAAQIGRARLTKTLAAIAQAEQGGCHLETPLPVFHLTLELMDGLRRNGYQPIDRISLDALKQSYLDRLDRLAGMIERYQLPLRAVDIQQLKETITAFAVKVPLIGAFSSGKSSLLNGYLGKKLLQTGLPPETAIAIELRPAAEGEKLVAWMLSGERREYPLSQLREMGRMSERLLKLEAHITSDELAQHPDIILVDMPGLDSRLASHNKAILNYIGESIAFILCVAADQTLKDSVLQFLQEATAYNLPTHVLMTKQELRQAEDLPALKANLASHIEELTGNQTTVSSISAKQGELDGFYEILAQLNMRKDALFHQRFAPQLSAVTASVRNRMELLVHADNLSVHDLARKKQLIEDEIAELDKILAAERERINAVFQTEVPDSVVGDVRFMLEQSKLSLKEAAKRGDRLEERVQGIVQNAFRVSINNQSCEEFMKTARKLNRYVSSQAYGGGDAVLTIDVGEIPAVPATSLLATGAGAVSIGALLGPIGILIGTVIGGLLSIFQRKKQERELARVIDEMITQVAEGVRPEVLQQLNLLAEQFFAALFEKVEAMKTDKLSQIGLLEEQLTKNKAETDAQSQMITADLVELAKLEEAQAAATLQAGVEPSPSLLP